MASLYSNMSPVKVLLAICLLLPFFDVRVDSEVLRKKRDNEAVLYGNQQGSPHRSIKKSGPMPLESEMKSEYGSISPQEAEKQFDNSFGYSRRKKLLKRAKRTLIKSSMENGMSSNRMLQRKKRYADELDPETLEKLRDVLQNTYDSYYSEPPSSESYRDRNEEEVPYLVQEPLYETEPEAVQKRQTEVNPDSEGPAYEIVQVNGVPGLFFPLTDALNEKEDDDRQKREEYRRKRYFYRLNREEYRKKRDDYRKKREDMEERRYNSKLAKLAEMLAKDDR